MPTPIVPQDGDDVFEITPEASADSIESFIESLNDWNPETLLSFGNAGTVQTDEEIAAEILNEEPAEEEPEEEPANEPGPESTPPAPVADPTLPVPQTVKVRGVDVPIEDVERLYEFDQFLRSNPDTAARVQAAVTPAPAVSPPPPAPAPAPVAIEPPDFLDMDDPAQKFMWDSHVQQQAQLANLIESNNQSQAATVQQRAMADMDTALSRFRASHPQFNDDQIEAVRAHGAHMNVIGAVMATTPNPVDALVRVMDLAALDNAELRQVYLTPVTDPPTPTRQQKSATRKAKLSALGGSSGSVPRVTPASRPTTDRAAIDQFAAELADSFQNN